MVLRELLKLLNKIKKCHPESADADVWTDDYLVNFVGFDKRHKPSRVKLEK